MKDKILKKVERRQKTILTDEGLSEYGYIRHGKQNGVQRWYSKEYDNEIERRRYHNNPLHRERHKVRNRDRSKYRPYKRIIDPEGLTCIHHNWIPGTAEYTGKAIVEKDLHQKAHDFVKPILILDDHIELMKDDLSFLGDRVKEIKDKKDKEEFEHKIEKYKEALDKEEQSTRDDYRQHFRTALEIALSLQEC